MKRNKHNKFKFTWNRMPIIIIIINEALWLLYILNFLIPPDYYCFPGSYANVLRWKLLVASLLYSWYVICWLLIFLTIHCKKEIERQIIHAHIILLFLYSHTLTIQAYYASFNKAQNSVLCLRMLASVTWYNYYKQTIDRH